MNRFYYLVAILHLFYFEANSQIQLLNPDNFFNYQRKYSNPQVLDIRIPKEFNKGYIKKAINIDLAESNFDEILVSKFSKKEPVFVYCQTGLKSSQAAEYINDLGFKELFVLDGGFEKWIMKSKPYKSNVDITEPLAFMTLENFYNKVSENKYVLVDFYADWCGPCKKMEPILKKLAEQNPKLDLLKIDADNNITVVEKFEVDEIPTLILFKNGRQIWRRTGLTDEKEINARLN